MRDQTRESIARQLTAHLTVRHESMRQFAKRSGVPLGTIALSAAGKHVPKASSVFRMAIALGCQVDDLIR